MRIVYYSSPSFSDCDLSLLRAFSDAGHEVFYFIKLAPYSLKSVMFNIKKQIPFFGVFPVSDYPELSFISAYIPRVKTFIVNNPAGKNNGKALRMSFQESRFINKLNADVIHYVETPDPFHLRMLWLNRRRVVCTIHDPVPHLNKIKFVEHICRLLSLRFIRSIVLLNNRQTDDFCKMFHVNKSKITYSSLGAYDCLTVFPGSAPPEGKYILMFGRITPYKGIERGIAAMSSLHSKYPDVRLIVAGSGEVYFDKALYEGKPYVEMRNRFIPTEEQVSLIKHSMFVLCPYTEATQSGVVQSAFGLGTPVVVTDVGALADYVINGENGLVVAGNNQNALTEAVRSLLENPGILDGMREDIYREKEAGANSWSNIANNHLAIYRAL